MQLVQIDGNYQCDQNNQPQGQLGRGVTTWELSNIFQIDPQKHNYDSQNPQLLTFTCTIPKCYSSQDSCNVTFSAYANDNNNLGNDIELDYSVNGVGCGGCHISGQQGHGGWQSFDISQCNGYNDLALNNFTISNTSTSAVKIQYFRILRVYKMCTLANDEDNVCIIANEPMCCAEHDTGSDGSLDYVRVDKPCNFEGCGIWSVTLASDHSYQNSYLSPGNSFDWYFDWTNYSQHNYMHGQKCLFNFNQIWAYNDTTNNDVQLDAYINDQHLATYYLSKVNHHGLFPTYDLILNNTAYNDAGFNHIRLTNNGNVGVQMSNDGINIYRVYMTYSVCGPYTDHADHSDHSDYSDHSNTTHSDYTYGDHADVGHSDIAHQDAAAHSDVSHSDVGHSDTINHSNYTDWYYYQDASYPDTSLHSNSSYPYTDFSDHSDVGHSNVVHSDLGTGHSDTINHSNYTDWYYYQDASYPDTSLHSNSSYPYTDFSNHSDYGPGHGDVAHSDVPHSDDGTYYNHSDTYPYPWPHVDYWGQPHSDIAHNDFNNHSDST